MGGLSVAAVLACAYGALLLLRAVCAWRVIRVQAATRSADAAFAMHEVAVLQPILGGDPKLIDVLGGTLDALPEARFHWLIDDGDTQAQSVIGRARELAERHAFPSSQMWNIEVYEQRLAIAAGQYGQAQDTLRRNAERYPAGNRRDFALILADVAAAGEAPATAVAAPDCAAPTAWVATACTVGFEGAAGVELQAVIATIAPAATRYVT